MIHLENCKSKEICLKSTSEENLSMVSITEYMFYWV